MHLATVLPDLSPENLRLAVQCGVTQVVSRYPGPKLDDLLRVQKRVEAEGLRLGVIEGFLPFEKIKMGRDADGSELAAMKQLVRHLGEATVPMLCLNFMAGTDWVRTRLDAPERGGARVTAFDLAEADRAVSLSQTTGNIDDEPVSADQLWENLERFIRELMPVAEAAGVTVAMHPDDPPLSEFRRKARILNSVEGFERLMAVVPSEHSGICFCLGTFVAMGVDISDAIRRLGPHIKYVHFRDVRGTAESFVETFHDNGPTDMAAVMRDLKKAGFDGPIRPDHVPQLEGEFEGEPGYTMKGRLFAFGYIRGLMDAAG